jgi:CHAP domain-containing protein
MRVGKTGAGIVIVGSLLALSLPVTSDSAFASPRRGNNAAHVSSNVRSGHRFAYAGRLQCVPFARTESGIELVGNAWTWWDGAAGVYQRGHAPEPGAVLAFRANGAMRLGHVAVVSRVINPREIEIEHANWGPGRINRGVPVVDVSENNDWTAVRVALARVGEFGNIYPTHGFIYDRPDRGMIVAANTGAPPPVPDLNPAPRDLRQGVEHTPTVVTMTYDEAVEEVAEAPAPRHRHRLR